MPFVTPQQAGEYAEAAILDYARQCGAETPEEVMKALEMLISKAARGIEKYCGSEAAYIVTARTAFNIQPNSQAHLN